MGTKYYHYESDISNDSLAYRVSWQECMTKTVNPLAVRINIIYGVKRYEYNVLMLRVLGAHDQVFVSTEFLAEKPSWD